MKTKEQVVIRISLDRMLIRLLVVVLLLMAATGSVASARETSAPRETRTNSALLQGGSGRRYYLTAGVGYDGAEALTACADGYHLASIWEIWDVSNLIYNTSLGFTYPGGDGGPPTNMSGWVRTGGVSSGSSTPGTGNCSVWTSTSGYGSAVYLYNDWTAGTDTGPWTVDTDSCNTPSRVWCVRPALQVVYLPLILRNY